MKTFFKRLSVILALLLLIQAVPVSAAENTRFPESDTLINILLVGRDSREQTVARSDCMILCSFAPEVGTITFTSFLRDLYVTIPGHKNNRLNAAYAFGGMELLQKTVTENFQMHIDGCIEVDFSSFPQIIDALGGVTITLRQDEADSINDDVPGTLTEGTYLLTGEQALSYSRIRKLDEDGDFSRSLRQRKLLASLLESYRSADLMTILSAVADTLPLLSTNLSNRQLLKLCVKLFPLLEDPKITSQRIPADGTYTYEKIRGMEVLTADMDILREQLHLSLSAINENVS